MGFMDFLGSLCGSMMAMGEEANRIKPEYERFSNQDLIREYQKLKQNGCRPQERWLALSSVLRDRGLIS